MTAETIALTFRPNTRERLHSMAQERTFNDQGKTTGKRLRESAEGYSLYFENAGGTSKGTFSFYELKGKYESESTDCPQYVLIYTYQKQLNSNHLLLPQNQ